MGANSYKFIDLFAGIGGFHLALHSLGARCVFASEIDLYARKTYEHNIKKLSPHLFKNGHFNNDILKITDPSQEVPNFDILCAGFPCQPFSQAGYKKGFSEELGHRGNMFFRICDIIAAKRPKAFFLENVRHLINHDSGRTFSTIQKILTQELGYSFHYKVIKASDYGLPQHRPRVFMVGFDKRQFGKDVNFEFPAPTPLRLNMSDVLGGKCNKVIGFTLRVGGRGSGLNDRRNWDAYLVDGKEKRVGIKEGKLMMGFPSDFDFPVSEAQAMKQLGNSVAINAVQATAKKIITHLKDSEKNISHTQTEEEKCALYA